MDRQKIPTLVIEHCLCDGCKNKFNKLNDKIPQVHSIKFRTEQGEATIFGAVYPATVMEELAKEGIKPKILWEKSSPINNYHQQKHQSGSRVHCSEQVRQSRSQSQSRSRSESRSRVNRSESKSRVSRSLGRSESQSKVNRSESRGRVSRNVSRSRSQSRVNRNESRNRVSRSISRNESQSGVNRSHSRSRVSQSVSRSESRKKISRSVSRSRSQSRVNRSESKSRVSRSVSRSRVDRSESNSGSRGRVSQSGSGVHREQIHQSGSRAHRDEEVHRKQVRQVLPHREPHKSAEFADCYLNHKHELEKARGSNKRFACDGCKEDGFNSRYRCERCNFDLHYECRFPKLAISPEIHKELVFKFRPQPPTEKICDACGKEIHGYFYNCQAEGMDLHPCCTRLKAQVRNHDMILFLRKKVSSKCLWCREKVPPGIERGIPGWCYVSECKKYNIHILCITQMLHQAWQRGLMDGTDENSMRNINFHFQRMAVSGENRRRSGTEVALKFIGILRIVVGVLLGDPSVLFGKLMFEFLGQLL